ncbi:MAG: hypothetical protein HRT89_05130 [Lentisphaeria bacterium]|nr:hypothetical protein [Lentisphaeria bacterium]NQZ67433.1 hypothetical protein [Lentisphaeria bacterium]
MFTGEVGLVSDTSIFARLSGNGKQYLVYQMKYQADTEVAMVLPLPVPKGTAEHDVNFLPLDHYPKFFLEMRELFVEPDPHEELNLSTSFRAAAGAMLQVQNVGNFEASFVPSISDFERLDPRFRIDPSLWQELPDYSDYGFAVFKLKPVIGELGVHAMAFEFPTRWPDELFYPTVHLHGKRVWAYDYFDHSLFFQTNDQVFSSTYYFDVSYENANELMHPPGSDETHGIVDLDQRVFRIVLDGAYTNQDTLIGKKIAIPKSKPVEKLNSELDAKHNKLYMSVCTEAVCSEYETISLSKVPEGVKTIYDFQEETAKVTDHDLDYLIEMLLDKYRLYKITEKQEVVGTPDYVGYFHFEAGFETMHITMNLPKNRQSFELN